MPLQAVQMHSDAYLQGIPLSEAVFKYALPEQVAAWQKAFKSPDTSKAGQAGENNVWGALQILGQGLIEIQAGTQRMKIIEAGLQKSLLEYLKIGKLFAWGFKTPRKIEDNPIKIPVDLFFGGMINWQNSTLNSQGLDFTGIRVFKNSGTIIDAVPNIQKQIENKPEILPKTRKQNFSDLDPEVHIDEKKAADFLGISSRTLQGYRLKGGGPKFLKLKKAVRYKIQDLIDWVEKNKKENTSQN